MDMGRYMNLINLLMIFYFFFNVESMLTCFTLQYKFGLRSCFHKETEDIGIRMSVSVLVQVLIGYVILPLYGLVTQVKM